MAVRNVRDLTIQRASEFFSSARRNIFVVIWLVRLIAIAFLFIFVSRVTSILNPDVLKFSNLSVFFDIILLFIFAIILGILTLASYVTLPFQSYVSGDAVAQYIWGVRAYIITNIFGNIKIYNGFDANEFLGGTNDPFAPLAYLLNKPQRILYNTTMLHGVLLLGIIFMVLTGIAFVRRSSVTLAGATLVIGQFVIGLAYMKGLTNNLTLDVTSISSMFGSSLFQLAFISYLYFEFSLQTGYLYSLTQPTLTRQNRVSKQLARLSEFRLGVTKLGTEEDKAVENVRKTKMEEQRSLEEEEEKKISTSLATGSGSTTAKKFNSDALVFLLDSAQDSLFARPGGEQERLTGRLQRYHDGLLSHDRKLDNKLGGSAEKAFNPFIVLFVVVTSLIIRVTILVIFAWLVLNPSIVLSYISFPPSITNSIELGQPEGILLILIPLVFFILGVSYFVTKIQSWVVKAEELIIQESEIQKLLKAGRAIVSRTDAASKEAEIQQAYNERIALDKIGTEEAGQPIRKRKKKKRKQKK